MSTLSEIFKANEFTEQNTPIFEKKLFHEGPRQRRYLVGFFALLVLSTIIASYGVINDSTATVIGAMIIAPLMTPIMGTAASLVMGNMDRAIRSVLLVVIGVFVVIALSWVIGYLETIYNVISISSNTQILGRIAPRTTDLMIALASGVAGAFALAREDIADSLPGVAISISLVPPLCVVGICLSIGEWEAAWGAMLLFLTNFLSILLAGGALLAFLGLGRVATKSLSGHPRRNAFIVIILGVLLISIPLTATGFKIGRELRMEVSALRITQEWLQGSEYDLRTVDAQENVTILIAGNGEIPSVDELENNFNDQFHRPTTVILQVVRLEEAALEIIPENPK